MHVRIDILRIKNKKTITSKIIASTLLVVALFWNM